MSKLDRQLDDIRGVERVEIVWPITEEMYIAQVKAYLKKEIDSHTDRIPLDLRQVTGAPKLLIDLLYEMREYAESKGRNLVISHALEDMRIALNPRTRQKAVSRGPDASATAREVLTGHLAPIQSIHNTEKANRESEKRLKEQRETSAHSKAWRRYLQLGLLSLVGTGVVVSAYWLYIFKLSGDTYTVEPVRKSFEDEEVL